MSSGHKANEDRGKARDGSAVPAAHGRFSVDVVDLSGYDWNALKTNDLKKAKRTANDLERDPSVAGVGVICTECKTFILEGECWCDIDGEGH